VQGLDDSGLSSSAGFISELRNAGGWLSSKRSDTVTPAATRIVYQGLSGSIQFTSDGDFTLRETVCELSALCKLEGRYLL
jgi:hypothetical protein